MHISVIFICNILFFWEYHIMPTFNDPEEGAFENIWGKGENAANQHFLRFPNVFPIPK